MKIHKPAKARKGAPTHLRKARPEHRERKRRVKTFTTIEGARRYVEAKGLKDYMVISVNYGLSRKYRVI